MTSSEPSSQLQPLIEALVEFHKTVPPINKTASAQYGKFADLETVLSTVTPHLLKNGLVVSQGFEPSSHDNNPVLVTQLLHVSGAQLVSRLPMVVAGRGKNPLHDWGGSCTYSRRYSLLSILGLTADMDVDGDFADEKPTTAEKPQPKKAQSIPGIDPMDEYLTEDERDSIGEIIMGLTPDKRKQLCKSFRFAFKLGDNAYVYPAITARKHQVWIEQNA